MVIVNIVPVVDIFATQKHKQHILYPGGGGGGVVVTL